MGPLTVVVLGACGIALAKPKPIGRIEYAGYAGIAASVAALWWVVIGGYSGLPATNLEVSIIGLALLSVSGASITVSLLYCKRLQDCGIGADAVTAARYIVLILLAGAVVFWHGRTGIATPRAVCHPLGRHDRPDRIAAVCLPTRHRPHHAAHRTSDPRARSGVCFRA